MQLHNGMKFLRQSPYHTYAECLALPLYSTTTHDHILRDLQANNIPVLSWPALSPDMTPIEHVWDDLSRRVAQRPSQPDTLRQMELALNQGWQRMPQRVIRNIIDSMRRRCLACVAQNGGHTRY